MIQVQPHCEYYLCNFPTGECQGMCLSEREKRNEYILDEYRSGLDSPPSDEEETA